MSINRFFNTHKTWEEWCGMILGIVILLSPWFTTRPDHAEVIVNALGVGILVFGLAQLEYFALQRWEEAGSFVLGIWLYLAARQLLLRLRAEARRSSLELEGRRAATAA